MDSVSSTTAGLLTAGLGHRLHEHHGVALHIRQHPPLPGDDVRLDRFVDEVVRSEGNSELVVYCGNCWGSPGHLFHHLPFGPAPHVPEQGNDVVVNIDIDVLRVDLREASNGLGDSRSSVGIGHWQPGVDGVDDARGGRRRGHRPSSVLTFGLPVYFSGQGGDAGAAT